MSSEADYTAKFIVHRPEGDLTIPMETWDGGNLEAAGRMHRNAVTRRSTSRTSLRTRTNLTVSCECDAAIWALKARLDDSSGRDRYTAIRQAVGPRGEAIGTPELLEGVVGNVTWPSYDLQSSDNTGMLEIESEVDE